ncbi:tetratricopeptide repeat protein [Streptomyces sp. LaPpAH-108]|uniref:tetratricopeptide repeat protein n=1 Tax=Streptomyces sp. LaPpAH-108 TaxID=1155714 RepID=UPI0003A530BE|nr:tetratricopeptide repeat protein [Streptomyces sp. LaPpAH-108]
MGEHSGGASSVTHNSVAGNAVITGPLVMAGRVDSLTLAAAPPEVTPRQVPRPSTLFVNRTDELGRLRAVESDRRAGPATSRIVVVSGLGGVGKTQLVAHWVAGMLEQPFPGGQLYADLEEVRRDGAVDVGGVVAGFLRSLGVHPEFIPAGLGERTALFRSVTAGRDTLVVVDNARQAAEVRPLVPGTGLLVVISRTRLPALSMDGAEQISVDPLDRVAGVEFVHSWRVTDADDAAAALVRLCGGLPLALRAVGEWLARRPHLGLNDAVRALGADGLPHLEDGTTSVNAVLDMAYLSLPGPTRELYRLFGRLPGTTVTAALVAAAGVPDVDAAMGDLLTANLALLAESADRPRRLRLHDVARAHAREIVRELPEAERETVLRAVTDFYVDAVAHADGLVGAGRFRLQPPPARSLAELCPNEQLFTDRMEALEWLDAERGNLLALLRVATEERWYDAVWQLCESLWPLYHNRKHHVDSIEAHRMGIEAARWTGRTDVEIRMRNQLARAHYGLGSYDEATRELDAAAELLGPATDTRLSGMIWETQGLVALAAGRPEDAHTLFRRALEANAAREDGHGVIVQTYNVAQALLAGGRLREALDAAEEATALAEESGDDVMLPGLGIVRARALHGLGRVADAAEAAVRAAEQATAQGLYARLDRALGVLGEVAASAEDARLRAACEAKSRELRRDAGVLSGDA